MISAQQKPECRKKGLGKKDGVPSDSAPSTAPRSSGSGEDTVDIGEYLELRAELDRVKEELKKISKNLIETRASLIEAQREAASLRKNSQTQRRFETEIANLVCKDAGNESMGKSVQLLGTAVILYLSMPLFTALIDLLQKILGEL